MRAEVEGGFVCIGTLWREGDDWMESLTTQRYLEKEFRQKINLHCGTFV